MNKTSIFLCKIIIVFGLLICFAFKTIVHLNNFMICKTISKNSSVLKEVTEIKIDEVDAKSYLPYNWEFLEENLTKSSMMLQQQCFFDGIILFLLICLCFAQVLTKEH